MRRLIFVMFLILASGMLYSQAWMQYLPQTKTEKELTFFDYQGAFRQWCQVKGIDNSGYYLKKGEKQKAYGWKQFKRWEIEMDGWYNRESGEFLYDDIYREMERVQRETANLRNLEGNWTPVAYTQEGIGNDGNGRINCVAFHPTNPDIFWVGTAWGGVWKTEDHGSTWTPLSDYIITTGISSIAIPSDYDASHTIYIGTGDRGYNRDYGRGILKSTDGGNTWQETSLCYSTVQDLYINRLLFLPGSTTNMIACTNQGIFKTLDGWDVHDTLYSCRGIDMEINPSNSNIIYVSTRWRNGDPDTRVIRTGDGGVTWDTVFQKYGSRTELAVSPDMPNVLYVLAANGNNALEGIYQSVDDGQTFLQKIDGSEFGHNYLCGDCYGWEEGGQGYYDLAIAADPEDAETVYIGGINVWKSTDGGGTWSINTNGYHTFCGVPSNVHVDIHWLDFQNVTNALFVTSDGGIYFSSNDGNSYTNISGGLMINQPYRISSSQQYYNEIIMGQQDNGIVLWHDNEVDYVGGGDGTDCLINPMDVNNQFFTNNSEYVTFTINHWSDRHTFSTPGDENNDWFKPIVMLPPDTVFYGGYDLWKSTEKGFNMTKVMNLSDTSTIRRIAIAPSNSNIALVLNKEHLWLTQNGFGGWISLNPNLPVTCDRIINMEIKETDPNVIWIAINDWNDGKSMYKSTDMGDTWTNISAGLPDCPWADIVQNDLQTNYEELYTCGYFGTYVKLGDNPWIPFNNGLPNVMSYDLDIYYDGANSKIRTGTHGRGVWESNLFSTDNSQQWVWTGKQSTDWNDYRNWNYMDVPSFNVDVVIPDGTQRNPHVYTNNAMCRNITIESGATLNISGYKLTVAEDVIVHGEMKMLAPNSTLEVNQNLFWESGSQFYADNLENNQIEIYRDFYFRPGAQNIVFDSVDVYFLGDDFSTLFSGGDNCGFGDLYINKTNAKSLIIDGNADRLLFVKGNLSIGPNAIFTHNSEMDFNLFGNLNAYGDIFFLQGKCNLKGGNKTIFMAHSSSFMNDLNCQLFTSTTCTLQSDLQVRGDMTVTNGNFNPAGYNLKLNQNLINAGGYLLPGTGRVTFYGNGPQTLTGYEFNFCIFDIAKTGDTLFLSSDIAVNCSYYNYTSGILKVEDDAVFTASDLLQSGIFGHIILKDNAQINLTKSSGSIDLNGIFKVYGGHFNVFGGTTSSFWPGSMNTELWVSGGTLDFKDQGIFLSSSYMLLEVITGGVIRTAGSFTSERNDFTPIGGYIELYGPDNVSLSHGIGGAFWDLRINKGVSRAQKVTITQNLYIDHDLDIISGEMDVNGKAIDLVGKLDISGTLTMTDPASVINVGGNVTWKPGSSSNISEGLITFKTSWQFMSGTNAFLDGNNTVKAIGAANSDIYHKDQYASFANLIVDKTSQNLFLDGTSAYPMRVNGNLTVKNGNSLQVGAADLIVNGTLLTESTSNITIQNGGSITSNLATLNNSLNMVVGSSFTGTTTTLNGTLNLTNGGTVSLNNFTLNGTLDINAGSVAVHNSFTQATGGHLVLDGGSFVLDRPYTGNMFSFSGITDLNGGFFEISYDGIQFGTGATVNFNGGNLRVGGHFRAIQASSFQPTSGAVELINTIGANIECNNGNYFHQLIINKTAGSNPCLLSTPIIIQDDLTLQSGDLSTLGNTLTINDDLLIEPAGRLTPGSGTVNIGGNWTNNRGTTGFIESTSSVWFNSSQPATINNETFYDLDIDKPLSTGQYLTLNEGAVINVSNKLTIGDGALLMSNNSNLSVTGDLHIKDGGGLNGNLSATGTIINCYGNWWDYNTINNGDQGFTPGQSTVFFKGSSNQDLIASGGASFYKLTLQKPAGRVYPINNVTVLNDFNIISGRWFANTSGLTHVFNGNFTCSDPFLWFDIVNTVSFEGNQQQNIMNSGSGLLNFGTLHVNRPAGFTDSGGLEILSDVSCANKMKIISGEVTIETYDLIIEDSLVILDDGYMALYDDVSLAMGDEASIYVDGGSIYLAGGVANRMLVTHNNTGYYEFLVENGGTITAGFTDFEYIGGRGLHIEGTGIIGGSLPLFNCTFSNTQLNGTLLQINNDQDLILNNVTFPENTWSGTSNIKKINDAGNIYLPDATGDFAGPLFEEDTYDRIHWPSSGIWDGDVSTEWHNAQNWRYNYQSPDVTTDVVIPSGRPNYPVFSVQETTVNSLVMEPNTSLTISKDSLTVVQFTDIGGALNLSGVSTSLFTDSLVWQSGSSASMSSSSQVYLTGNMFIRRGSNLNLTTGSFYFRGDGESQLICHDTAQIGLLKNYKNAPYSLSLVGDTLARLTIFGNYTNGTNAILKCPSSQEWLFLGVLQNTANGHFRCENGTFRLRSSQGTLFKQNTGDYFNNMIIETLTKVSLTGYTDTLRIKGDLIINPRPGGGTPGIQANAFKIIVWGNWINNVGTSAFTAGTSKVAFWDPDVPQQVHGNTTFYNVDIGTNEGSSLHFYDNNTIGNVFMASYPAYVYGTLTANIVNNDNDFSELHLMDGGYMQVSSLIQGGQVHAQGGTLNVTDLSQDYVSGTYIIDNGLVNLGQIYEASNSHDLYYSDITINGGELRFTGGNGISLWPRVPGTASVTMTGGIFDLTNQEVFITTGNFNESISGGKIRTTLSFSADPAATTFHPTGGTVELYGTEDCSFSLTEPTCWFYNMHINKTDGGGAYPSTNLRVKNEFRMISGYMETDGHLITVGP